MSSLPPYHLDTYQDVCSFLPPQPNALGKKILSFSKKKTIVKPPILSLIPEETNIVITELKQNISWDIKVIDISNGLDGMIRFIEEEKEKYIHAVSDIRKAYFDVFADINVKGSDFLNKKDKKGQRDSLLPKSGKNADTLSAGLQQQIDGYKLLARLLKTYLSTRNQSLRKFISKSISQIVSFDSKSYQLDSKMIERLLKLPPSSSLVLNDLHTLFCERLERVKTNMFAPHSYQLVQLAKNKITRLSITSNMKKNFIDCLSQVRTHSDLSPTKKKIDHLMRVYKERAEEGLLRKIKSVSDNLFEKLATFRDFLDNEFSVGKIDGAYKLFCRDLKTRIINIESVSRHTLLTLYPCKDYHDFLKGIYSSDCTKDNSLSAKHLLHPRFFNIRIFRNEKWIGCIYCLDYSDKNVLILDRIQIKNSAELMPIDFFPTFMTQLLNSLKIMENLKVLGPLTISNFGFIQSSYARYCKGRERMEFQFVHNDKIFECAAQKLLYVLS